jgi:hypothetical protein
MCFFHKPGEEIARVGWLLLKKGYGDQAMKLLLPHE